MSSRFPDHRGAPVPSGRLSRLLNLGGMAAGIAARVAADGLSQIAQGSRPDLSSIVLTPANAIRFAESLAHMRGAAMKLGQMLSMDAGVILPPVLADTLAVLREDAKPMPPSQLERVLDKEWGLGWKSRFTRFDLRPVAAASIGQVHRAVLKDGRDLAIKVQYPGVRESIDSDIANIAGLMRIPGLLPRGADIGPLLAQARDQLREEADYQAEAARLQKFCSLLEGSEIFMLPDQVPELTTRNVLAMSFIDSRPLESLANAPQQLRDQVAAALITLTLRELFEFGCMQTDPNLANYRFHPESGRIVLLDFGAVRDVHPTSRADFRTLLKAALNDDNASIMSAMQKIGYFNDASATRHQSLILRMFRTAMAPLRQDNPFDFGRSDLLQRLRDMGLAIGSDRELSHVPPAEVLFLHRKIGGMYLMAAKLRARIQLSQIVEPFQ